MPQPRMAPPTAPAAHTDTKPPIDPRAVARRPFTGTAWLHLLAIIGIWASPFLFRWPLIGGGIVLYYLQILWLGDCILTQRQFDAQRRSVTFYYYLLVRLGFAPNGYRIRFYADYIMPWIILGMALIWQVLLGNQPVVW